MNFEYETQGTATFLVYRKQKEEQIDSISMGMISNNKIEGIIPFAYIQMDDEVCFKYNVSAYNTLEQYFSGVVEKKRFLTVLNSIMKVFIQSEDYMLEPSSFVLELPYIFVNPVNSEAMLIALPLLREVSIPVEQFIRNLVFGTQFSQTEDCSYIAAIISFLNANKFFSARDFNNLTEKLLKEERGFSGQVATPNVKGVSPVQKAVSVPMQRAIPAPKPKTTAPVEPKVVPSPAPKVVTPVEKTIAVPSKSVPLGAKESETSQKKKSLFGKKEKKQTGKTSSVLGGIAIPGMDVPPSINHEKTIRTGAQGESPMSEKTHVSVPEQKVSVQMHNVKTQYFGETVDLRSYVEQTASAGETTVLNATEQEQPFFLNIRTSEKYIIAKEVSRIGKDCEINDFCIKGNSAVSRAHANIYMQSHLVYIEDNGSTNGTYLDGMKLVPMTKSTALEHGMRIRLGNEELEFRTHE